MNLAESGYSVEENEEAIHYGRGFEEYRNNLLGGAQARGRRGGSYSEDGVLTGKKRGRRQWPETSAFDQRKGAGRSGARRLDGKSAKVSTAEVRVRLRVQLLDRAARTRIQRTLLPRQRLNPPTPRSLLSRDSLSPCPQTLFRPSRRGRSGRVRRCGIAASLTTRVPPPWPPVPPRPLLLPLRSKPEQLQQRKHQRRHT